MLLIPEVRNIILIYCIVVLTAWWKMFEKAGIEGWKALIPFYNMWILAEIAGRPGWLGLVMVLCTTMDEIGFIAAVVVQIIIYSDLAKAFGKGMGFTIGMLVLPIIFFPVIAFGKSTFR